MISILKSTILSLLIGSSTLLYADDLSSKPVRLSDLDLRGSTALMRAARHADVAALKQYLPWKAVINIQNPYTAKTALAECVEHYTSERAASYKRSIGLLLEAGADPRRQDRQQKSVLDILESLKESIPQRIHNKIQAKAKELDRLEALIHDPKYGSNALMYATAASETETVLKLLGSGVNPNVVNPINGQTALFFAIRMNNANLIQTLLNFGADPYIRERPDVQKKAFCNKKAFTPNELLQKTNRLPVDYNLAHLAVQSVPTRTLEDVPVLNTLFDGIYVLNLDHAQDRYQRFSKQLRQIGSPSVERVAGIYFNEKYGKNPGYHHKDLGFLDWNFFKTRMAYGERLSDNIRQGQAAVLLGHYEIIKKAHREGKQQVLIFEDDIHFKPTLIDDVIKAFEILSSQPAYKDWHLLYLDGNLQFEWLQIAEQQHDASDFLVRIDTMMMSASAYVVRHTIFEEILRRIEEIFDKDKRKIPAIDVILAEIQNDYKNSYFISTLPAFQYDAGLSLIMDDKRQY